MKVTIGVSNRHVHLTEEDYKILFKDIPFEKAKDLVQTGEFASTSKVTLKTNKNEIQNVRILGPLRKYTQVEVSKTDCYFLGINPPIRNSGDIDNSEEITIIGPYGEITKKCCIVATRHIHINLEDRIKYNLIGKEYVSVKVGNDKKAILQDVYIKESSNGVFELHLDTDDANANFIKTGDIAEII